MVLRAACSIEASTFPNGVRITDREGRTPDVAATEASVDSRTVNEGRGLNARFSLFKWFKRAGNRDSSAEKRRKTIGRYGDARSEKEARQRRSVSSSVESVDTFYSTTTVRSFAFHTGTLGGGCNGLSLDVLGQAGEVGPFAAGASKVAVGNKENESAASTLPANVHRRDITARYSLQPSSATFNSCGNLSPLPDRIPLLESLERLEDERKAGRYSAVVNSSTRRRVHVKGKRRAPNPPASSIKESTEVDARETAARNSSRRKRRAPKPPERIVDERDSRGKKWEDRVTDGGMDGKGTRPDTEDVQTLSNDTLVLQGGVLLSRREIKRETRSTRDTSGGSSDTAVLHESQSAAATVGTLSAAMPRPWYKRSVFEHSRDSGASRRGDVLRAPTSSTIEIKEECGATNATTTITTTVATATTAAASASTGYSVDASLSRLSFFHRGGSQAEDRKREAKRRSGLSILTNISELDKEAAAIVQEEQARARASMLFNSSRFVDAFERRSDANEELVQDIVTSAMESSSPRRGTRALISKFNAISNITKVTVNSNFFARNARDQQQPGKFERDAARNAKVLERDWKDHPRFSVRPGSGQAGHVEKDISRYFPPQQKAGKASRVVAENAEMGGKISGTKSGKEQNDKLASETSNRISLLQSQLAANRTSDRILRKDGSCAPATDEKIRLKHEEKREKEAKTSNEDLRRYLFPRNSAEPRECFASSIFEEPRKLNKQQRLDGVQKEFSDIFDEIDKQLRMKEFKFIDRRSLLETATPANQRNKVGEEEEEAGISSKVTKVLDILVEAEKDAKTKSGAPPEKSIILEDTSRPSEASAKTKSGRSPLLNTIEDPITTDLKEMLKEMKHSLPKRSKPGKIVTRNTDVTEKPVVEKETVNVPDPGKTRYFVSAVTKVENITVPNDYELDKQKVSCSVQTSGNIRRLSQPSTSVVEQPSTSGWKQENVLYKTSGKSLASSGLKNTFQLIRPRDFAEIEATKTTRSAPNENTYANVIEQSIYANAHVPPPSSPKPRSDPSRPANVTKIDNNNTGQAASKASPTIQREFPTQEDTFEDSCEEGNFN